MMPLRRAVAADAPACAAILDAWIAQTPWMPRRIDLQALEKALAEGLPRREAYVIGAPVLGYISLEAEAAHIRGLYVARRGGGLGTQLIEEVRAGRDYLQLNTHAANEAAHRFYERVGFRRSGDPWIGEDGIPEIRMEWRR